jgi:hypothetical protein
MESFWQKVTAGVSAVPADSTEADRIADDLSAALDAKVYPGSIAAESGALLALVRGEDPKSMISGTDLADRGIAEPPPNQGRTRYDRVLLFVTAGAEPAPAAGMQNLFTTVTNLRFGEVTLFLAPCSDVNAGILRRNVPWTRPEPLGGRPSFGLGDRLGLATPGHVRAVRGTGYVPMLAQQSIREMTRTGRSPQDVMDDATWGVVQTGFRDGFGADADHLKTDHDIYRCAEVGFTFYTIDPGDHVNNAADGLDGPALAAAYDALPWEALATTASDARAAAGKTAVDLAGGERLVLEEEALLRAAVKYGPAVAHTAAMYRYLVDRLGEGGFELEVSVDETDSPTTPEQHLYVASELARLGVRWVSLAPRFVGRFEKGVDYIGDLEDLERTFVRHLAVAWATGDYKISLHSGSDKFSVYRMAARHGGERVHVKTAGTSYLEALRVLAACETALFREILGFARDRYETDKATYHVSAQVAKVPPPDDLADADLPALLDDFDARQVLHVTYGSVLTAEDGERFRGRLLDALRTHEAAYEAALARHIGRHLAPFVEA